jgi:hypothetical protein
MPASRVRYPPFPPDLSRVRSIRPFRDCLVRLGCLLLAGCATTPPPKPSPPPLISWVTSETIPALAEFAAKTRMCREAFDRETEEDIAGFFRRNPEATIYPAGHGTFWRYGGCMRSKTVSLCDATAEDLGSLRTLLREDPRLAELMSFDQLLAARDTQCPSQADLQPRITDAQARGERVARKCEDVWVRPVLTTLSAGLRSPDFSYDPGKLNCSDSLAYQFLEGQCTALTDARRRRRNQPRVWPPDEMGVEEYLCPLVDPKFIPQPPLMP